MDLSTYAIDDTSTDVRSTSIYAQLPNIRGRLLPIL